jgi:hypothetical protein
MLWLLTLESTPLIAIEESVKLQCYQLLPTIWMAVCSPKCSGLIPEESPCERRLHKPAK